jgi:hypothetical protein
VSVFFLFEIIAQTMFEKLAEEHLPYYLAKMKDRSHADMVEKIIRKGVVVINSQNGTSQKTRSFLLGYTNLHTACQLYNLGTTSDLLVRFGAVSTMQCAEHHCDCHRKICFNWTIPLENARIKEGAMNVPVDIDEQGVVGHIHDYFDLNFNDMWLGTKNNLERFENGENIYQGEEYELLHHKAVLVQIIDLNWGRKDYLFEKANQQLEKYI